jgi:hypothetical protein
MAATYPTASTLNRTSGRSKAPAFNNSNSGKAAKSVAAFSQKSIKGTPKRTSGH